MAKKATKPVQHIGTALHVSSPAPPAPGVRPVAPAAPAAPAPAFRPPSFGGDAQLFGNIAQARFHRDTQITQLHADDVYDTSQHQDYVKALAKNQLNTDSSSAAGAAKAGLSYSGFLSKSVADNAMATGEKAASSAAQLAKAISDRGAQYQALTRQYGDPANPNDWGLYGVQEMAASRQRFLDSDPGGSARGPAAPAPTSAASGDAKYPLKNSKTGQNYRESTIGGVKYHVYSDGRKVKV